MGSDLYHVSCSRHLGLVLTYILYDVLFIINWQCALGYGELVLVHSIWYIVYLLMHTLHWVAAEWLLLGVSYTFIYVRSTVVEYIVVGSIPLYILSTSW
jgi:hypothetical protein